MKKFLTLFFVSLAINASAQSPLLPAWANTFRAIEDAIDEIITPPDPSLTEDTVIAGDVVINEFMAINQNSVADQDGEYDDWIELYNNTDSTINLSGLYLADDPDSSKWALPDTVIGAHDYLIIWADNDTFQNGLHAYFRLSGNGETIWLGYQDGTTVDSIEFGDQNQDISSSRIPNGTGPFQPTPPTFSGMNTSFVVNDTLTPGSVVINEFMAENDTRFPDQNGEFDDWIELYNNTDTTLSLNGLFLSDDPLTPAKWAFPDTFIQPMDFLIIWADEDLNQDGLHANFRLDNNGEFISLAYADGQIVDSISYGPQRADTTYGRSPNGSGPFGFLRPTFAKDNSFFTSIEEEDFPNLSIYPNPTNGQVNLELGKNRQAEIKVYSVHGQEMIHTTTNGKNKLSLDLSGFPKGMYFIRVDQDKLRKIILR